MFLFAFGLVVVVVFLKEGHMNARPLSHIYSLSFSQAQALERRSEFHGCTTLNTNSMAVKNQSQYEEISCTFKNFLKTSHLISIL